MRADRLRLATASAVTGTYKAALAPANEHASLNALLHAASYSHISTTSICCGLVEQQRRQADSQCHIARSVRSSLRYEQARTRLELEQAGSRRGWRRAMLCTYASNSYLDIIHLNL